MKCSSNQIAFSINIMRICCWFTYLTRCKYVNTEHMSELFTDNMFVLCQKIRSCIVFHGQTKISTEVCQLWLHTLSFCYQEKETVWFKEIKTSQSQLSWVALSWRLLLFPLAKEILKTTTGREVGRHVRRAQWKAYTHSLHLWVRLDLVLRYPLIGTTAWLNFLWLCIGTHNTWLTLSKVLLFTKPNHRWDYKTWSVVWQSCALNTPYPPCRI